MRNGFLLGIAIPESFARVRGRANSGAEALRPQLVRAETEVLACKLAMSRAAANVPKAMSPH